MCETKPCALYVPGDGFSTQQTWPPAHAWRNAQSEWAVTATAATARRTRIGQKCHFSCLTVHSEMYPRLVSGVLDPRIVEFSFLQFVRHDYLLFWKHFDRLLFLINQEKLSNVLEACVLKFNFGFWFKFEWAYFPNLAQSEKIWSNVLPFS